MEPSHIEAVEKIEKKCFSDPWSREMFLSSVNNAQTKCAVCMDGDEVLGYSVCICAHPDADIANIAVSKNQQGRHIGSFILENLLKQLQSEGFCRVFLEVRVSNGAAIGLYKKYGFETVGVRKKYYEDGEGAYIMTKEW